MSTDKLIDSDLTRADLVCLLRKAQAERDEYQRRELDAESALTLARLELESLKREALPAMIVHVNVRTAWESGSPEACAAEILRLIKQGERAKVKRPEPVERDEVDDALRFLDLGAHWTAVCAETPAVSDSERHALAALAEAGIANPSTALLRARLTLGHTKEARDLAHGWPGMLGAHGQADLVSALDQAETIARAAYRHLLTKERLSA